MLLLYPWSFSLEVKVSLLDKLNDGTFCRCRYWQPLEPLNGLRFSRGLCDKRLDVLKLSKKDIDKDELALIQ